MSLYDAIYEAVADAEGATTASVRGILQHREIPDDSFWPAWDELISEARELYKRVLTETHGD